MANRKEWGILSAVIEHEDGAEGCLEQLSETEKEEFKRQVCRKISQNLSAYYTVHREEWEELMKELLQEDR